MKVPSGNLIGIGLTTMGLFTMWGASLWAPLQPEFLHDGAACQFADCGTLEDPQRSEKAWQIWWAGLIAIIGGGVVVHRILPRLRGWPLIALAFAVPAVTLLALLPAFVVSWSTSDQGGWTALLTPIVPMLAILVCSIGSLITRAVRSGTRRDTPVRVERMSRIFTTSVASVYPHYVTKVERKGRTVAELHQVIEWLTGFDEADLTRHLADETTFEDFFAAATLNPKVDQITGSVCGVRVQEVEDPLMRQIRYLDKLVDELAKGRPMDKILRS